MQKSMDDATTLELRFKPCYIFLTSFKDATFAGPKLLSCLRCDAKFGGPLWWSLVFPAHTAMLELGSKICHIPGSLLCLALGSDLCWFILQCLAGVLELESCGTKSPGLKWDPTFSDPHYDVWHGIWNMLACITMSGLGQSICASVAQCLEMGCQKILAHFTTFGLRFNICWCICHDRRAWTGVTNLLIYIEIFWLEPTSACLYSHGVAGCKTCWSILFWYLIWAGIEHLLVHMTLLGSLVPVCKLRSHCKL